uniref:G protein-coupled receptor n=1 Tax=Steinernema glaseri TaxID=37863 RepID=A0A1I7XZU4_9BILA
MCDDISTLNPWLKEECLNLTLSAQEAEELRRYRGTLLLEAEELRRYRGTLLLVLRISARMHWFTAYPVLLVSLFIIYLSVFVVPYSLARVYCVNIAIQSILSTVVSIVDHVYYIAWDKEKGIYEDSAPYLTFKKINNYVAECYLYFSALIILMSYLGVGRPVLFRSIIQKRPLVIVTSFGLYVWCFFFSLKSFVYNKADFPMQHLIISMAHTAISTALYATMITLYVLTLVAIMSKKNVAPTGESSSRKVYWNTLKSILIFCTLPNIAYAITISSFICRTHLFRLEYFVPDIDSRVQAFSCVLPCYIVDTVAKSLITIRLLLTSFTALLAFSDYRAATRRLFQKVANRIRGKTDVHELPRDDSRNSIFYKRSSQSL